MDLQVNACRQRYLKFFEGYDRRGCPPRVYENLPRMGKSTDSLSVIVPSVGIFTGDFTSEHTTYENPQRDFVNRVSNYKFDLQGRDRESLSFFLSIVAILLPIEFQLRRKGKGCG